MVPVLPHHAVSVMTSEPDQTCMLTLLRRPPDFVVYLATDTVDLAVEGP